MTIGGARDTMDPDKLRAMARALPNGRHLHLPDGSHMSMFDDPAALLSGCLRLLARVDNHG